MFDGYYEAVIADTPLGRQIHHQIRYAVYCLETGFEHPDLYPDGEERDPWDQHSIHLLVRHRATGQWVGAMRLIRPVSGGVLPIHALTGLDLPANGDHGVAEVSRLCVLGAHRREVTTQATPDAQDAIGAFLPLPRDRHAVAEGRRKKLARRPALEWKWDSRPGGVDQHRLRGPEIMAGLLRAAMEYSRDHGITHWYFLTNPSLARLVKRMKVEMLRVGDACYHRGLRHPYWVDLNEAVFSAATRCQRMAGFLSRGEPYRLFSEIMPEPRPALRAVAAA